MMRSRLTTGLTAGVLLALAPASLAQFSANDFMESAGTYEAPAQQLAPSDPGATFAADVAPEPFSAGGDEQAQGRPMIGVLLEDKDGAPVVQAVIAGGPAEAAGLKSGDVIVSIGDRFTGDLETLRSALGSLAIGDSIDVGVSRGGSTRLLTLTLADSETLDLPEGPEDLEEPVITDEEIVEQEIELELVELEDIAFAEGDWIELEDVEIELSELTDLALIDGEWVEIQDVVLEADQVTVLEDVTLRTEPSPPGQPTGPLVSGWLIGEVVHEPNLRASDITRALHGAAHGAGAGGELRVRRNVVPIEPGAQAGACCDCDCSCAGASSAPKNVQVWTTVGPEGQVQRQTSKQVDVSNEIARALKEAGLDDDHIAEALAALEAHQMDGELSFGLSVGGAGVAEPKVFPKRVRVEAPKVTYRWRAEAPHAEHGGDQAHAEHGGDHAHAETRVQLRTTTKGTNAASAPSSGYFFDAGENVEVEVERREDAYGRTEQHPKFGRGPAGQQVEVEVRRQYDVGGRAESLPRDQRGRRIQKPKRPSTDGAEEELELLRSELRALRSEIRELRSAIRARGR